MSKWWRYSKFLVCIAFLVTNLQLKAQGDLIFSTPDKEELLATNGCVNYYYEDLLAAEYLKLPKFKWVTESFYTSDDTTSAMRDKKYQGRTTTYFNALGEIVLVIKADSAVVTDSTRTVFDKYDHTLRQTEYQRSDSGVMRKVSDERWVYDAKGNPLKDSLWGYMRQRGMDEFGEGRYARGGPEVHITITRFKYDLAGNAIENISITDADTTKQYMKYDAKKRKIFQLVCSPDRSQEREYTTYDTLDNPIITVHADASDSTIEKQTFDDKGRVVKWTKEESGKIVEASGTEYRKDGSHIETREDMPITNDLSCPDNSKTVTVYDSAGNVSSEQMTRLKNGKPVVSSTIHKLFYRKGFLVLDSAYKVESGFLYSSTSIEIKSFKYDVKGNKTEQVSDGGGEYTANGRETWIYNDHDKILLDNAYNACNSDRPEKTNTYTYYKGGEKIKTVDENEIGNGSRTITNYAKDGKKTDMRYIAGVTFETIYTYGK